MKNRACIVLGVLVVAFFGIQPVCQAVHGIRKTESAQQLHTEIAKGIVSLDIGLTVAQKTADFSLAGKVALTPRQLCIQASREIFALGALGFSALSWYHCYQVMNTRDTN